MTFSSSCPASHASATVVSQPITWKHTWLTISGIDGFTLPGMIDDPGWTAGSVISASPARGPMLKQPQIARDLAQLDREPAHRARVGEDVAHALRDAEQIVRGPQRQPGVSRQVTDHQPPVVVAGVQAGADRRGADVQLAQLPRRLLDVVGAALDAGGVAAELLAERDRHRVLKMGAAGLEDVGELVGLSARGCARAGGPASTSGPAPSSSASRVAVGNTSFVDWPMLT